MTAVSIVVPTFRGADRIGILLSSLARQTSRDFEVVVAVDGDVDGTAAAVATWQDRLPVRTVVLPENRGRAAALNAGFAASTGQILVRSDDDLVVPPSYVADQVALHDGAPVGVVGLCRNVYPDNAYARIYGSPMDLLGRTRAYAAPAASTWRHWGANVSVTRTTHDAVGEYDEGYTRYGWEDVDWGYRLHLLGVPIVIEPRLEADHHVAATTTGVRATRAYWSGTSQVRFEQKHATVVDARDRPPASIWERLVARTARDLDPGEIETRADRIERTIARQPEYLARKRIALLVEAAGRAGYRTARTPTREASSCRPH